MDRDKDFFTVTEAAEILNVSYNHLVYQVNTNKIKSFGNKKYILEDDLMDYIHMNEQIALVEDIPKLDVLIMDNRTKTILQQAIDFEEATRRD